VKSRMNWLFAQLYKYKIMTIKMTREFDPLTRQMGFSARLPNDGCFAFSEREAAYKLASRHDCHLCIEWTNGSLTVLYATR